VFFFLIEAVQNERDRIAGHKRVLCTTEPDDLSLSVNTLYNSEIMVRQVNNYTLTLIVYRNLDRFFSCIQIGAQVAETQPQKVATANDITESMKQQLLLLVEWAKSIKVFCDLSTDDKVPH
jgi:nuclear factor 4